MTDASTPGVAFALHFVSGKYEGRRFPLPSAGEILLGRSRDVDVIMLEEGVSRRHARIIVSRDKVVFQDLGSTNGSLVNGEKVKRARLQPGDRLLLGSSIIKLVTVKRTRSFNDARLQFHEMAQTQQLAQVRLITGSIGEVPLPDLMQLFGHSKKTGVLAVTTDADVGKIYFELGKVYFASINDDEDLAADKALYRIVTWQEGNFELYPPTEREVPRPLNASIEGLLMEAMRQMDELAALDGVPDGDARLTVVRSPLPTEVSPEELELIELVKHNGHVQTVLDRSSLSDADASAALAALLQDGTLMVDDRTV